MTEIKPFTGLIVADFTHVLAGPACAYYLGLLGAEVIKVESVTKGDAIRHRGGTDKDSAAKGMSTSYLTQGGGKRSIALELESPQGREKMHKLLSKADIFVENHLPDTLRRLELDEASTTQKYPQLIHCAMTGYGRGGKQENARAYDVNIQAACGIMAMTGTEESGPTRTGAPILDYSTALAASFAISAALYQRSQTGKGGFVDVSMLETGFTLMSSTVTDYLKTGNEPKRRGNLANSRSPGAGSFACKSGIISLGVNEESHFESLARALGRVDWLTDTRYASRARRVEHAEKFAEELERELKKHHATEIDVKLQDAGVPAARLRTLPEALASDQVKGRQFIHTDPATGLQTPTLPFRLFGATAHIPNRSAPHHGADTEAVEAWLEKLLTDD